MTGSIFGEVEQVIDDLERHAERLAEAAQRVTLPGLARSAPTSQAPGDQGGRLGADQEVVLAPP